MGATATYTCPHGTATEDAWLRGIIDGRLRHLVIWIYLCLAISVQKSQCIWDKGSDEMVWYPAKIHECSRKASNYFACNFFSGFSINHVLIYEILSTIFT